MGTYANMFDDSELLIVFITLANGMDGNICKHVCLFSFEIIPGCVYYILHPGRLSEYFYHQHYNVEFRIRESKQYILGIPSMYCFDYLIYQYRYCERCTVYSSGSRQIVVIDSFSDVCYSGYIHYNTSVLSPFNAFCTALNTKSSRNF
jgi:hypothetical protein